MGSHPGPSASLGPRSSSSSSPLSPFLLLVFFLICPFPRDYLDIHKRAAGPPGSVS